MAPSPPLAVVAVDVGGTAMKGWVCAADGSEIARIDRPTPVTDGIDAVVAAIGRMLWDLRAAAGPAEVVAGGVVVPGLVDTATGVAHFSANIGWRELPLRALLAEAAGIPLALDHDVRAGGLAEALVGAARGVAHALFVPIGTGIAAAVIAGGDVYAGRRGMSGEFGHIVVHLGGEICGCGQRGCVEAYASAAAISRRYHSRTGQEADAAEIEMLAANDPVAAEIWDDAVGALAAGLAAATALLDPELIVLGGGLIGAGDRLLGPLREELAARLPWRPAPSVVRARLGADAGRVGAAVLAWRAAGRADVPEGWIPP